MRRPLRRSHRGDYRCSRCPCQCRSWLLAPSASTGAMRESSAGPSAAVEAPQNPAVQIHLAWQHLFQLKSEHGVVDGVIAVLRHTHGIGADIQNVLRHHTFVELWIADVAEPVERDALDRSNTREI